MTRRRVNNPLALAVLACLGERPMHPYEISTMLRSRGKDQSIKLNYGSLYAVVSHVLLGELPRGVRSRGIVPRICGEIKSLTAAGVGLLGFA